MLPYLGPPAPRQNDSFPGVKDGTAKSPSALGSENGKGFQIGTSSNAYDVDALADHFGMLMKSDMPPSLEVLLRPFPPNLRRSLHFEPNAEGILPILSDDNAACLRHFVLDYLTGVLRRETDLVELLHKQEALLYFLVTYPALVQDRAGRHGLRITKPLFDGQAGAGRGAAAMKRQWAATEAPPPATRSAPAGGPGEKGPRWPGPNAPAPAPTASPDPFLALELVDVACRAAAPAVAEAAVAVSRRLERAKHWQRTGAAEPLGPGAGGAGGPAWTARDKCCLAPALLLLGLVLWMCVEVGVVEVRPADLGAGLQEMPLN